MGLREAGSVAGGRKRPRKGKYISLKFFISCEEEPVPPESLVRASSRRAPWRGLVCWCRERNLCSAG